MTIQKIRLVSLIWFAIIVGGCIPNEKSILVREGVDQLACQASAQEYYDDDSLGINSSVRRRHIRSLQKEKACVIPPKVSIGVGYIKVFD